MELEKGRSLSMVQRMLTAYLLHVRLCGWNKSHYYGRDAIPALYPSFQGGIFWKVTVRQINKNSRF